MGFRTICVNLRISFFFATLLLLIVQAVLLAALLSRRSQQIVWQWPQQRQMPTAQRLQFIRP